VLAIAEFRLVDCVFQIINFHGSLVT
jgi:hypothetical protein